MSNALGSLLIGEEVEEKTGLTGAVSERFPLNSRGRQLLSVQYDGSDSDRVRLRKVLSELTEQGIKCSGAEPSQYVEDFTISWAATFNRHGELKGGVRVMVSDSVSDADLESTQAAFQSQGFATLVTEARGIRVLPCGTWESDLVDWLELGLDTKLDEVPLEDARIWIQRDPNFTSGNKLANWYTSAYDLETAARWIEASRSGSGTGLDSVGVASDWIEAGADPDEAAAWQKINSYLRNFENAEPWRERFSVDEAACWIPASVEGWRPSLDKLDKLQAAGVDLDFFTSLRKLGFSSEQFSAFSKLAISGCSTQDLLNWAELGPGVCRVDQLRHWIDAGVAPDKAAEWHQLLEESGSYGHTLYSRIGWIADWVAAGLGPDDAKPWVSRHDSFWDYQRVSELQQAGFTLEDMGPWVELIENLYGSYHSGDRSLLTAQGIAEWASLGSPFDKPETVGRMLSEGLTVEQVSLVLSEISAGRPA